MENVRTKIRVYAFWKINDTFYISYKCYLYGPIVIGNKSKHKSVWLQLRLFVLKSQFEKFMQPVASLVAVVVAVAVAAAVVVVVVAAAAAAVVAVVVAVAVVAAVEVVEVVGRRLSAHTPAGRRGSPWHRTPMCEINTPFS